jgi:glucose-1-phosphate thymidylyltransferase
MKGIILCGGSGSRMGMFTRRVGNKHLIPVYNRPMIEFPLSTFSQAGVTDIAIVTSNYHAGDIAKLIGDGKEFGFDSVSYFIQVGDSPGIAHALKLTRPFLDQDECFAMILGDNFYSMDISDAIKQYHEANESAMVFLEQVPDPQRFGIAELDDDGKIVSIVEKPQYSTSNLAVTGLYFLDTKCFDFIDGLKPSARGELEITDVLEFYKNNHDLAWTMVKGYWSDMGTLPSMNKTTNWIRDNHQTLIENGRFKAYRFKNKDGSIGDYIHEIR